METIMVLKVSFIYLHFEMKDKIIHIASQLFIKLGFKSVTMDDIAQNMAISKKTIYEYFKNKTELIEASSNFVFQQVSDKIDAICDDEKEMSPIKNLFDINTFLQNNVKTDDNAPEYQLQRYYPSIAADLNQKKYKLITEGIIENLESGIESGFYREDIDIPTTARFYFIGFTALQNSEIFRRENYRLSDLMQKYLIYHIRAIATPKGIKELERIIKNEK